MTPNLEKFRPKLRSGRVIPQGSRIIFETDDPYNQIALPTTLADLVLLCSGQFTVREIVEKIYHKQGIVPFKSILTAIHLLRQGGFFENGDQLILSPHLQSWMEPRGDNWRLSWRFGQRISAARQEPVIFYLLTLVVLLGSIFGLQHFPGHPVELLKHWAEQSTPWGGLFELFLYGSLLQTIRYSLCGAQLLLLTSKVYNVSLRLSPWGLHLHVGDEANDLFENRLYTSMFHLSQILVGWIVVLVVSSFADAHVTEGFVLLSLVQTIWELNPFRNSDWKKMVRALMIPNDRDVSAWHFDSNAVVNSVSSGTRGGDQDFARVCSTWGSLWVLGSFWCMGLLAVGFGPPVLSQFSKLSFSNLFLALLVTGAWLGALYYLVQCSIETLFMSVVKPVWLRALSSVRRRFYQVEKTWSAEELMNRVEELPLFSHFHGEHLEKIINQSKVCFRPAGSLIIEQGQPARELYVLLDGRIEVSQKSSSGPDFKWVATFSSNAVFGEAALVDDRPREAKVTAKTDCSYLCVPVSVIRAAALEAKSVRQLEVFRNAIMVNQYFASSPVFRSLSPSSVNFLCSRGALQIFDANQTVFNQGDLGDSLYLILRGEVSVNVNEQVIKNLPQGSFFGEIALIANIPRTAAIKTTQPSVFFMISADSFWEVLVEHMDLGIFIETISEHRLREDLMFAKDSRLAG